MPKFKKLFIHALVVLLALQGTLAAMTLNLGRARAAAQDVVINEVMWTGTQANSADEWIELYNTLPSTVSIAGWSLTNVLTNSGTYVFGAGTTIAPHSYYLIGHNVTPTARTVALDQAVSNFTLPTTCSTIQLIDNLSALVDQMGCNGSNHFYPSSATIRHALERNIALGSGNLIGSWHERTSGSANIDTVTYPLTLATPAFVNDTTAPVAGSVQDDGAFTASTTQLHASWSGFSDPESGVVSYQAGVGLTAGTSDVVPLTNVGTNSEHTFTGLSLAENATYYINVVATNGVALTSQASSDGITVNTVDPTTPTNLTVSDVTGDSGGSIQANWDASTSPDVVSYQINYRRVGDATWTSVNVGNNLTQIVSGLQNAPITYEFTVEAIDFNNQHSAPSSVVTGQARDNLPPTLDGTKLTLNQNAPGTTDTVQGAAGSSTEAGTASVYNVDPAANPSALPIGSMALGADFSFLPISIGDNLNGTVWVQMADLAGNRSQAVKLVNDIVAPNAPTLTKVDARCPDACQVTLNWTDNGPDTLGYQVGYTPTNGSEERSLKVSSPSATLSLNSGTGYDFVVYAFDAAGNVSAQSNAFHLQLVSGVETIVTLVNGTPVTTTTALSGAKEATPVARSVSFGASKVQAAAPTATPTGSTTTASAPTTAGTQSGQNWAKIVIIVALLLVIAGGFYFLSRSYGNEEEQSALAAPDPAPKAVSAKPKPRARRRRSRRKRPAS